MPIFSDAGFTTLCAVPVGEAEEDTQEFKEGESSDEATLSNVFGLTLSKHFLSPYLHSNEFMVDELVLEVTIPPPQG